mmetsp:Transcript_23508/g.48946  ORF Transcript_23508/g.48946 Transcript_23508/m.48946 type:complete len:244 (+) Transcript_23508:9762-10493(+)
MNCRSRSVSFISLCSIMSMPKMSRPGFREACNALAFAALPLYSSMRAKACSFENSALKGRATTTCFLRSMTCSEYDSTEVSRSRFMLTLDFSSIFSTSPSIPLKLCHSISRLSSMRCSSSVICTSNLDKVLYMSSRGPNFFSISGRSVLRSRMRLMDSERVSRLRGGVVSFLVLDSKREWRSLSCWKAFWLRSPVSLFCQTVQWLTREVLRRVQSILIKLIVWEISSAVISACWSLYRETSLS